MSVITTILGVVLGYWFGAIDGPATTQHDLVFGPAPKLITGMIADGSGRPVKGAVVRVFLLDVPSYSEHLVQHHSWDIARLTTDDQGEFHLFVPSAGEYRLCYWAYIVFVATSEELAGAWFCVAVEDVPVSLTMVLQAPKVISGAVVDGSGRPIARARVMVVLANEGGTLVPPDGLDWCFRTTDAEGRFEFNGIPPSATVEFIVAAEGMGTACFPKRLSREEWWVPRYRPRRDVKLILHPEGTVSGRVVEARTGKGVSGIPLVMDAPMVSRCVSDSDGGFVFRGLSEGQYRLWIAMEEEVAQSWVGMWRYVLIRAGESIENALLELESGATAEFVVTGLSGKPLTNAFISLSRREPREAYAYGFTDPNGLTTIRALPGSYDWRVSIPAYFALLAVRGSMCVPESGHVRQDVRCQIDPKLGLTPRRFRLLVCDTPSRDGMDIRLWQARSWGRNWPRLPRIDRWSSSPGADGSFEVLLDGLPAIVQRQASNEACVVTIEDFRDREEVRVKLRPAVTLQGQVKDSVGRPVPNAAILASMDASTPEYYLSETPLMTDANGTYQIRAIPTGRIYSLLATAEGFGQRMIEELKVPEGAAGVLEVPLLVLPDADGTLSGVVVDKDGQAVEGAEVVVHGWNGVRSKQRPRWGLSDKQGKFVITEITDDRLNVHARYYGRMGLVTGRVDVNGPAQQVRIVINSN